MAMTIHCDIVSAEEEIFSGLAQMVVATGTLGELGIGYGHNFAWNKWHVGWAFIPAFRIYGGEYFTITKLNNEILLAFSPRLHGGFGWHWDRGFVGFNAEYEGNYAFFGPIENNNNRFSVLFWAGFMLKEPRFIGGPIDWFENRFLN